MAPPTTPSRSSSILQCQHEQHRHLLMCTHDRLGLSLSSWQGCVELSGDVAALAGFAFRPLTVRMDKITTVGDKNYGDVDLSTSSDLPPAWVGASRLSDVACHVALRTVHDAASNLLPVICVHACLADHPLPRLQPCDGGCLPALQPCKYFELLRTWPNVARQHSPQSDTAVIKFSWVETQYHQLLIDVVFGPHVQPHLTSREASIHLAEAVTRLQTLSVRLSFMLSSTSLGTQLTHS